MNERSSHISFQHNAPTESYKRSDHNDFATTSELKSREFTGTRHNTITDRVEFWVLGEIRREITQQEAQANPNLLQEIFISLFRTK